MYGILFHIIFIHKVNFFTLEVYVYLLLTSITESLKIKLKCIKSQKGALS